MNQILYTGNNENNISLYKNNISMPIIIIVMLLIILILIFSFRVYAKSENETVLISNINNTDDTQNLPVIETSKEQQEDENTGIELEQQSKQETEKKNQDVITYTASNGESYSIIGTLNIPSLGIEYPILSSTSTELLKISLNKYWGANPNEVGNMVIVGHNYENSKFFSKLPNIQIGKIVKITDIKGQTLDYTVYDTDIIDPYDNTCTSQLTNGYTEITLITCYNNGKQRFVAKARADI